jgi:anthranilate phosphoribosyltransferase
VVTEYEIDPAALGFGTADLSAIRVTGPEHSRALVLEALENRPASRATSCVERGHALYAADVVPDIGEGVARARAALADGRARARLDAFVAATRRLATI